MIQHIEWHGEEIILDTDHDTLLFAAPRAPSSSSRARVRGRDLDFHESEKGTALYYLVLWSLTSAHEGSIRMIGPLMAERFLGQRGLECHISEDSSAYSKLKNYGYGIAEEF